MNTGSTLAGLGRMSREQAGFDAKRLGAAVAFAEASETSWPRDLTKALGSDPDNNEPAPWNEVLGATRERGGPAGLILRHGGVVATWGDINRPDMTFSVAKSYLALLAGVAVDRGLIRNLDDPVRDYSDGYESPQNRDITWRHMLQQTSEWEGTLFGKPDLIDRHRQLGAHADNTRKGTHRDLQPPGEFWEYNDVRVNRLSLSLLHVFRRPLPEVFAEAITEPIGCTDTWEWVPYRNAWVELDGQRMPSVPGGAHWGGGVFISAADQARIGLLVAARGRWGERQLISSSWFDLICQPCPLKPDYGLLWWLNTDRSLYPAAPEDSLFALGAGQNLTWISRSAGLVVVVRWIDGAVTSEFIGKVMSAIDVDPVHAVH